MKKFFSIYKFINSKYFFISSLGVVVLTIIYASFQDILFNNHSIYTSIFFEVIFWIIGLFLLCFIKRNIYNLKKFFPLIFICIGLEFIIIGGLISKHRTESGTLSLSINEERNNFYLNNNFDLIMSFNHNDTHTPLKKIKTGDILYNDNEIQYYAADLLENAFIDLKVTSGQKRNPAIKFSFLQNGNSTPKDFWLVSNSEFPAVKNEIKINDTIIFLRSGNHNEYNKTIFKVKNKVTGEYYSFNADSQNDTFKIDKYTIKNFKFFPFALPVNGILTNSNDMAYPAIEFEIYNDKGRKEEHTRFAFLPQLPSLHGKSDKDSFPFSFELIPSIDLLPESINKIIFEFSNDSTLTYYNTKDKKSRIPAIQNTKLELKDLGILTIKKIILNTEIIQTAVPKNGASPTLLIANNLTNKNQWISIENPFIQNDSPSFYITQQLTHLPFSVKLIEFIKNDSLSNINLPTYIAKISLYDPFFKTTEEYSITHNSPLTYKGYKLILSSYKEDPSLVVFNVSKTMGTIPIYIGVIFLLFGIATIFRGE